MIFPVIFKLILFVFVCKCVYVFGATTIIPSHSNPSVKHFEPTLDSSIGYWSPSDSTIDWCERNYAISYYIAEFWNCISSLIMCFSAYLLYRRGHYNKIERRFLLFHFCLGIVGFGSALFHGTMKLSGQMADELPMIYTSTVWHYLLVTMNRPKYADADESELLDHGIDYWKWAAILYVISWTYFHSIGKFVLLFQAQFVVMVVGALFQLIRLHFQPQFNLPTIRNLLIAYVIMLLSAMICWLLDQHFCYKFNNLPLMQYFPNGHSLWHILCGLDCHVGIVCCECMRVLSFRYNRHKLIQIESMEKGDKFEEFDPHEIIELEYEYGVLPFVKYPHNKQL